jgi:hypothetical protein
VKDATTVLLSWGSHWLEERSGSDSYCTVQLDEGRNDELTKDAKNALPRKRGSLAAGEVVRLRLILQHRTAQLEKAAMTS